jgi:ectoine hydroxylase-related dioxygenase (phytanoyl-CoA dioxygenase family)
MIAETGYLAGKIVDEEQIAEWVERFHRDGYLFLPSVLPPDWTRELRDDLDRALAEEPDSKSGIIELHMRMFETSRANLRLFDLEPIASFAEALIGRNCHVIHNNSFLTPLGKGITSWHQDDPPHYLVTHGDPPTNVLLPVLLFTGNYYLTGVPDVSYGPTEVIPGSHLFGKSPPEVMEGTEWEDRIMPCAGPEGSLIMFNNQVWHRGGPNLSDRVRYVTQVSYARRIIGHKYGDFMNYQMPEHVYRDVNPRLKRLLGFLPHGAYG